MLVKLTQAAKLDRRVDGADYPKMFHRSDIVSVTDHTGTSLLRDRLAEYLTDLELRRIDVLYALYNAGDFVRHMYIGATDASHHNRDLNHWIKRGFATKKRRNNHSHNPSFRYSCTVAGAAYIENIFGAPK